MAGRLAESKGTPKMGLSQMVVRLDGEFSFHGIPNP